MSCAEPSNIIEVIIFFWSPAVGVTQEYFLEATTGSWLKQTAGKKKMKSIDIIFIFLSGSSGDGY
jgi:hypothetical protein